MKPYNKNDYQQQLSDKLERNTYEYIYVSFGGKINERSVHFQHPNITDYTNALYQMIPTFIQSGKKILCIIVDDFHDNDLFKYTEKHVLTYTNEFPFIDIVFIDFKITINNSEIFIQKILNLIPQSITTEQFMICNFIRFRHPNNDESILEETLPKNIKKQCILCQNGKFKNRFYQWFGYMYYLHNYIYNYETYHIQMFHIRRLYSIIEKILKNQSLNTWNEEFIDMSLLIKNNENRWHAFKQNTLCFI